MHEADASPSCFLDEGDNKDSIFNEKTLPDTIESDVADVFDIKYNLPDSKAKIAYKLYTSVSLLVADTIGCCRSRKLLRILFDTGAMCTMIQRRVVPESAVPKKLSESKQLNTLAGRLHVSEMVVMRDVRLPEFDKNRKIESHRALIFDQPCRYDMILGADFLRKVELISATEKVIWNGMGTPFL